MMSSVNNNGQGGQEDISALKIELAQAKARANDHAKEIKRLNKEVNQRDGVITQLQGQLETEKNEKKGEINKRDDTITQLQNGIHERDTKIAVYEHKEANWIARIKESKEEKKWKAIAAGISGLVGNTLVGIGTSYFLPLPLLGAMMVGCGLVISGIGLYIAVR